MSSSTSTDGPWPSVEGFAIESVLGRGPRGTVYVATQAGLGRRVALKLYAPADDDVRHDLSVWPEHPGVARLHVVGSAEGASFTASQLALGGSLAARLAAAGTDREDAVALCDQVEATLAELPVAHGALGPGNVLIDGHGRALLCDFGMAGVDACADADRRALTELRARCQRLPSGVARRRRRAGLLGAVVVAGAIIAAISGGDGRRVASGPPEPLGGAQILGGALIGGTVTSLGCDGRPPNGSAPACTIVPVGPGRRALAFPADGVVRRWAVRGARGVLLLQILRPVGGRRHQTVASAQPENLSSDGVQAFATDLAVRRGDLPAIALRPGAGVGVTRRSGDATTWLLLGRARYDRPRRADQTTGTSLDGELQLRVEYVPGARARPIPVLSGSAARAAPAGRRLATRELEYTGLRARTFALVALPDGVAIDLLRGSIRLRRIAVGGADPRGTLSAFEIDPRGVHGPTVSWVNPDGREIVHHYHATAADIGPID